MTALNIFSKVIMFICLSFGARAGSYQSLESTGDVDLTLTMVRAAGVELEFSSMTFNNLAPGDVINASQLITLTGEASRSFTCYIDGQETTKDFTIFSTVTITISITGCTASAAGVVHSLIVTSSAFPSSTDTPSDSLTNIPITIAYDSEVINL